ncbi:MAG TPA: glycosyltransferase family 2 protein [Flavobacterium sp.]|jgi:glycosyltransferase involved in cell wall biosynthesis|uniref:glycosyltransferase family 2 protein n=1 Tax=Chryseobacterium sp. TaxID=1871047 RepID=UPI00260CAB08|nr:glycosyltransferase family 2 protein [Chryseobacterium sp.]MDF2553893.1 glycosyltransferase [Chryseobacterium sp.]MDF2932661.1 glycosyltransferase [Chryseobacterium sp.]HJY14177.1 glycosyltransferase family 2 protein [Flavobacterium sp.]
MKVSIITVCWNSEKYLKSAIQSILDQTYSNIEYIIVDGGSTDDTLNIIKEYEPLFNGRMRWITEKDKGIYDAMNKGIAMTSGDVVGLLNSDDIYISKNVVENVANCFLENNIDSLFSDLYYVKEDDTNKIVRKWKTGKRNRFSEGWHPAHPTFFVRKQVYDTYGVFDLKYRIAADFELMLRFLEKYNISSYYLKEYILKMRLGGESNRSFSNIKKGNREIIDSFKKHHIEIPFYYTYKRWLSKVFQYFG